MKTRYLFFAASLLGTMPMAAQETYENAKLTGEDLNGTARYVGMGGAMDALGADLSTISSNPCRNRTLPPQHNKCQWRTNLSEQCTIIRPRRQDQRELRPGRFRMDTADAQGIFPELRVQLQ